MREAFDSEILHDLFDLLFEVHHFRLEFRSLFYAGGSFGIGKTHHRVSVKRRFEEEDFKRSRTASFGRDDDSRPSPHRVSEFCFAFVAF